MPDAVVEILDEEEGQEEAGEKSPAASRDRAIRPMVRIPPRAPPPPRKRREQPRTPPARDRLERHEGAQRDTRPAWMTKGFGIGTEMFGESKGDLVKPGMTQRDFDELRQRGPARGGDPFAEVFNESMGGGARLAVGDAGSPGTARKSRQLTEDEVPSFSHDDEIHFDGTGGNVVEHPFSKEQNPSGSFTVDFMARSSEGAGYRSPVCSRDMPPPSGYIFFLTPLNRWVFWLGLPDANAWLKIEGPEAREGEWQRITGTYDIETCTAELYVDGERVATKHTTNAKATYRANRRAPLRIGAGCTDGVGVSKFFFAGDVSSVRVYDDVLAPLEETAEPPLKRQR